MKYTGFDSMQFALRGLEGGNRTRGQFFQGLRAVDRLYSSPRNDVIFDDLMQKSNWMIMRFFEGNARIVFRCSRKRRKIVIHESYSMSIDEKYTALQEILREMGGVAIGFSGGVDSTLLFRVAAGRTGRTGGRRHRAVFDIPRDGNTAKRWNWQSVSVGRVIVIETEEDKNPKFLSNPVDRCYHCKTELFSQLAGIARQEKYPVYRRRIERRRRRAISGRV